MAKVDYTGVPEATAQLDAPQDYQHVEASPRAFGSALDEGVEAAGQGALDASKFYGTVAADDGTNTTLQQVASILHGDSSKHVMGPDGQMVSDTGYFGKRGADAMNARADVAQEIDSIIQENREGLSTPQSKLQYDVDTRRYRAQWLTEIGTYADAQQKVWATDTNNTSAVVALNQAARTPNDPTAVADAQGRIRKAYVRNAQLAGEDTEGAMLKADQDVAMARIRSLIVSDPQSAQKVLAESAGVLGSRSDYDQITRQVKDATINSQFAPAVDGFMNDTLRSVQGNVGAPSPGAPPPQTVHNAFLRQESGNNPNIQTSDKGAIGIGQIEPATFAAYAKPGEKITNPQDNAAVSGRIIDDYSHRYNGDMARVAVAYFSGPGNVAPAGSATPWIQDRSDGHTTVSQYVSGIQSKLAQYPSTSDALNMAMPTILDNARTYAEKQWPNYPDVQERFVSSIERRTNQSVDQQRRQYDVDTHVVETALAGPHPPISEDQLMASSPQVAQAWQRMQLNNPYAAMAVERRFDANSKGPALGYGTGFKDYLDRVLAPSTDPNRITNPAQLNTFVGSGEDAVLTNTGVDQLSGLLNARGTPKGEAFASQVRTFVDDMHAELTFSNASARQLDPKGEALFSRFMAQALPILESANQSGNVDKILDPKGPDYLGKVASGFARTPAQMMKDRLFPEAKEMSMLDAASQGRALLKDAVGRGQLTQQQAAEIGETQGWFAKAAPGKVQAGAAEPPQPEAVQIGHIPGTEAGGGG